MTIKDFARKYRLKTKIDEDLTVIIPGKVGHIFEFDTEENQMGVMVIPNPPRKQYWGFCRKSMIDMGFTIKQNGDGEGTAVFDPGNPAQVKEAIRVAGVRRRRELSPEHKEKLAKRSKATQFSREAPRTGRAPAAAGTTGSYGTRNRSQKSGNRTNG